MIQFCFKESNHFLDKMKPVALMKLAAQCAEYYHEAQKQLQRDAVRGLFDKVVTVMYYTLIEISAIFTALYNNLAATLMLSPHNFSVRLPYISCGCQFLNNCFHRVSCQSFCAFFVIFFNI